MPDDMWWKPLERIAPLLGVLMALAALGMIGRFAMLLSQAWQGHPRLVG